MTSQTQRRSLILAPAVAIMMAMHAGPPALAQPSVTTQASALDDDGLTIKVRVADLATSLGRVAVRRRLEAAADAYCRGHPGEVTTVSECRHDLTAQLVGRVEARTGIAFGPERDNRLARK